MKQNLQLLQSIKFVDKYVNPERDIRETVWY